MFYISKEELEDLYFNENLTFSQIEEKLNIKRGRIYNWFKKYNIKAVKFFISKEDLEILYFEKRLSYIEIEEHLGIKRGRIYNWFKKYNIKPRDYSESNKGKVLTNDHKLKIAEANSKPHTIERCKNISKSKKGKPLSDEHKDKIRNTFVGLRLGDKHPMWRGGLTKIRNRLRQSTLYKRWRSDVYIRDNYTCKMCNNGGILNAHHIITFYNIRETYKLVEYDDYINCKLLWETDNGITLCESCHKSIKGIENEYEDKFKKIIYEERNK